MKTLFLFMIAICIFHFSQGVTRNVPQQYRTIQRALNACNANDTVLVKKGIYYEHLNWPNVPGIKLISVSGSSKTFIDGSFSGTVMKFYPSPGVIDRSTEVNGFTISNGRLVADNINTGVLGAGIAISNGGPKFINCTISGNRLAGDLSLPFSLATGAAVYASLGSPQFDHVNFINNSMDSVLQATGILFLSGGDCQMDNCTFKNNSVTASQYVGGGICLIQDGNFIFNSVIFSNNSITVTDIHPGYISMLGGLVNCSALTLTNCLISNNSISRPLTTNVEGLLFGDQFDEPLIFMNCTVANNTASDYDSFILGISVWHPAGINTVTNSIIYNRSIARRNEFSFSGSTEDVTYSDINGGYTGTGNINSNPRFVSSTNLKLKMTSPCINTGTNANAPANDLLGNPRPMPIGSNADMGCYEMNQPARLDNGFVHEDLSLTIYPNPVSYTATISLRKIPVAEKFQLQVVDVFGRVVKEMIVPAAQQITFLRDGLPNGIYFFQIKNDNQLIAKGKMMID